MEQNKSKPKAKGVTPREERLKAALKANMGRRKAQVKARAKTHSDVSNGSKDKG